jgi:sialidase-1
MGFKRREFLIGLLGTGLSAQTPESSSTDLFEAKAGGYALYRIPGVVVTRKGTVLIYAEARRHTGSDWDDIDLLLRRSTDGSRTFGPEWKVPHVEGASRNPVAIERKQGQADWRTYNNPVAIPARSGRVHFLFCVEYMRVFYAHSDDDGRTFSPAVEITSALEPLRSKYPWRVVATGPGHGIELHNGRLVVPVWIALGTQGNGHGPSVNTTIYSDDQGKTWHCGEIAVADLPEFPSPNETALIENSDGSVTMNIRTVSPRNRRAIAKSPDGATGWSPPRFDEMLPDPICAAGLVRVPRKNGAALWAFSNPNSVARADRLDLPSKDRRNLTLRLSRDEGRTWKIVRVLEPGPSAYSDLAIRRDTLLSFYETKTPAGVAVLRPTRLPLSELIRSWQSSWNWDRM